MSVKSKVLSALALAATMALSGCVTHGRDYGYGGGYRSGYQRQVSTGYPRTRTVYRSGRQYETRYYDGRAQRSYLDVDGNRYLDNGGYREGESYLGTDGRWYTR